MNCLVCNKIRSPLEGLHSGIIFIIMRVEKTIFKKLTDLSTNNTFEFCFRMNSLMSHQVFSSLEGLKIYLKKIMFFQVWDLLLQWSTKSTYLFTNLTFELLEPGMDSLMTHKIFPPLKCL